MISPASFCGGRLQLEDRGARAALPHPVVLDADVTDRLCIERLLLRAHDRLQARVARLVDRVTDADHGRQLDLDGVIAVLGLALAGELAVGDVHLDHLGERRHLQVVRDDGADRVALAVVRLLAEQDQIGALGLKHLGEGVAGRADVRAGQRIVGEVDRAVGSEGDRLVEGPDGALRAHRHGDDLLDVGAALLDLHRRLEGVGVEGVEVLLARAVQALGLRIDPLVDGGVRDLFDEHADLQVRVLLRTGGAGY